MEEADEVKDVAQNARMISFLDEIEKLDTDHVEDIINYSQGLIQIRNAHYCIKNHKDRLDVIRNRYGE